MPGKTPRSIASFCAILALIATFVTAAPASAAVCPQWVSLCTPSGLQVTSELATTAVSTVAAGTVASGLTWGDERNYQSEILNSRGVESTKLNVSTSGTPEIPPNRSGIVYDTGGWNPQQEVQFYWGGRSAPGAHDTTRPLLVSGDALYHKGGTFSVTYDWTRSVSGWSGLKGGYHYRCLGQARSQAQSQNWSDEVVARETITASCPKGLDYITIYGNDKAHNPPVSEITWWPPDHPDHNRSIENSNDPQGIYQRTIVCIDSTHTKEISYATPLTLVPGRSFDLPALNCPDGMVLKSFSSRWIPADGAAPPADLTVPTNTPSWVRDIPSRYPQCIDGHCELQLSRLDGQWATSCGADASKCADWYVDAERGQNYRCLWGQYTVELHYCSVFRDPGRMLANTEVDASGRSVYVMWPPLELSTGTAARLADRAVARYGTQACAVLGEKVRASIPAAAVTDSVAVCQSLGLLTGIDFVSRTPGVGLAPAVQALIDGADGPPLTFTPLPDCEYVGSDGRCLDDQIPESPPEPQPAPAGSGAGIPPAENCLDDVARQQLVDSMPDQYHHMATHYGAFGDTFRAIVSKYNLDLSAEWNLWQIKHRGPHPASYHNWVLSNMIEADELAQTKPAQEQADFFVQLFKQSVVDVVQADPTIVRVAYWNCRDDYIWR